MSFEQSLLFPKMMKSIKSAHSFGNTIRMLKFPLILTDTKLYAGAIANFYYLTKTLERRLNSIELKEDEMIQEILKLNLHNTSKGYESDLKQLFGKSDWKYCSEKCITNATNKYCNIIQNATVIQLVSVSFILYGALVIGGGKATQKKVKKIFSSCDHVLFDVSDDIRQMRKTFKKCYNNIGKKYCESQTEIILQSKRFMEMNNSVIFSIRCLPYWWKKALIAIIVIVLSVWIAIKIYH
eukprot:214784_1